MNFPQMYRSHISASIGIPLPEVSSGAELIELVKKIPVAEFEAGYGLQTKPPFPGFAETPEHMPTGWRMICACRLYDREENEIGVLYSTFVSGRRSTVVFNAPGTFIPEEYLPLASR